MEWNDFVTNVQGWAQERGIYEHSTPNAQEIAQEALKTQSIGFARWYA